MSGSLTACIERLEKEIQEGGAAGEKLEKGDSDMGEADSPVSSEGTPERGDSSEAMRRADRLERELDVNPLLYEKHLEFINLLGGKYNRKLLSNVFRILIGTPDLDRLRSARERMQAQFPLSEELWISWLLDEIPIAQINKDAFSYVISLFDKAVADYLSVQVRGLIHQTYKLPKLSLNLVFVYFRLSLRNHSDRVP